MILKLKKGIIVSQIENGEENPVGSVFETANEQEEKNIQASFELLPKVLDFVKGVNTGDFKPRSAVKSFEEILKKYGFTG